MGDVLEFKSKEGKEYEDVRESMCQALKRMDEWYGVTAFKDIKIELDYRWGVISNRKIFDARIVGNKIPFLHYVDGHNIDIFEYRCERMGQRIQGSFLYYDGLKTFRCTLCRDFCELTDKIKAFFEDEYSIKVTKHELDRYVEYVEFVFNRGFITVEEYQMFKKEPQWPVTDIWGERLKLKKHLEVC